MYVCRIVFYIRYVNINKMKIIVLCFFLPCILMHILIHTYSHTTCIKSIMCASAR